MKLETPKKTILPADLVNGILHWVRNRFYSDDPKRFFQDRRFLMRLATWPARWLENRGLILPRPAFEKLVLEILRDTSEHCNADLVKFVPGYLLHSIQEHFRHHGEEIYEENKSTRNCIGLVISGLRPASSQAIQDRTVEVLAQVNSVLAPPSKSSRKKAPPEKQLTLL